MENKDHFSSPGRDLHLTLRLPPRTIRPGPARKVQTPLLQRPRHSQGLARQRGFEERTRPDGDERRQQAAPHGGGENRAKPRSWGTHQTPRRRPELPRAPDNSLNSAWDPEEAPLLRVTGQRTASGARPARAAALADFALIGWTPMGGGTEEPDKAHAQYGPMRRREILPAARLTVEAEMRRRSNCKSLTGGEEGSERSRWPQCNCRNATERARLLSTYYGTSVSLGLL